MAQASSSSAPAAAERDEHGIAFFDVETSVPLRAGRCALLEFGAVVVCPRTLVEVSSFSTLVRPADPDAAVPATTARCNGITRDAIATAPPFRDVADIIYGILHGRVWAGHNIMKFDSMIIWEAFAEIGRAPPQPKGMIDTLPLLTQQFGRRAGDMKMASLANYFGLGRQKHRSLDDVRMNIDVLKYCATVLFLEASPLEVQKPDEAYFPGELVVSHGIAATSVRAVEAYPASALFIPASRSWLFSWPCRPEGHLLPVRLRPASLQASSSSESFAPAVCPTQALQHLRCSALSVRAHPARKITWHNAASLLPGPSEALDGFHQHPVSPRRPVCRNHFCPVVPRCQSSINRATRMTRNKIRAAATHGLCFALSRFLRDVTSESQKWTIRVRVTRFSEYRNKEEPPQIVRLDLILLDEEGTTIEGQIPQRWLPKFMPQLKEDSIYYIQDFQVCNARTQYRSVNHPYMMKFTSYTRVTELNAVLDTFPKYAYSLATYAELRGRIGSNDCCSDTIGVFTGCTHVKIQNTKTGPKKLRNIYLTDGREPAIVALWNEHAESFDAEHYMQMAIQGPVVFLFVAVTCGQFQGKLSLQGSASCKWYANPEIAEAVALQDSCAGRISTPTWHGPAAAQLNPQRITIAELAKFSNPHDIYDNRYIVKTKIKSLVTNQSWWYLACDKCKRRAQPQEDQYKCFTPRCPCTSAAPRYRLPIIATDPIPPQGQQKESTVELVFFGSIAQEIVGVPVDSLIATEGGTGAFLPTRITSLYGRQFELCISPSPGSLQRTSITYQVDRIVGTASVPVPLPAAGEPPLLQQEQTTIQQQGSTASSEFATTSAAKDTDSPCIHSSIISSPNPTPKMPTIPEVGTVQTPQMQHTPPIPETSHLPTKTLKRTFEETQSEETENNSGEEDASATGRTRRRLNVSE